MAAPVKISAHDALDRINEDHCSGWQGCDFEDSFRVLDCREFSIRLIEIPSGVSFPVTHPSVVKKYRDAESVPPPPFFDGDGFVIDGTHRLEAYAGRVLLVYVQTSYTGELRFGNITIPAQQPR